MAPKSLLRWIPIVVAIIVGGSLAMWPSLEFVKLGGPDFASRFAVLIFFSLLIERTVEVVMSIWRSEEANKRESEVRYLIASKTPADDETLINAQLRLIEYKAETMKWAMPLSFTLGLLVSAFGVRALSQFIDLTTETGKPLEQQLWWFNMSDIVFTGALLAGGADPIHKLLDLYRKAVESSAAKASGTKQ